MCGIVGCISSRPDVVTDILDALTRLESRGYDSAGIVVMGSDNTLSVRKNIGRIFKLRDRIMREPLSGQVGIAHTRWATHGKVTENNAHPHTSESGRVAVVHNGIIENFRELRNELQGEGYVFKSATDTEVIPHLIERELRKDSRSLEDAVAKALAQVRGAYAIAVISSDHPGEIVAARFSSSLLVGIEGDQLFLASDEVAFAGLATSFLRLGDRDIVTLRRGEGVNIRGRSRDEVNALVQKVKAKIEDTDLCGFETRMEKETFGQAEALRRTLKGRIDRRRRMVRLGGIEGQLSRMRESRLIHIVACGTSFYAGLIGKRLIESFTRIPVMVTESSEFIYTNPIIGYQDVILALSQSGETADTRAALELARKRGALLIGVTNVVGSSIASAVDAGVYLQVGLEEAVASTKAFTAQCAVLAMMAALLADEGDGNRPRIRKFVKEIERVPSLVAQVLLGHEKIAALARHYALSKRVIFIGRSYGAVLAREGALKLMEIAYVDTVAYPAGEFKHGPIALIEPGVPAICIVPNDELLRAKMLSNMEEIKTRGGEVIAIAAGVDEYLRSLATHVIEVPLVRDERAPIVYAPVVQLFALYLAKVLGKDVDHPRNLAKSVTVE